MYEFDTNVIVVDPSCPFYARNQKVNNDFSSYINVTNHRFSVEMCFRRTTKLRNELQLLKHDSNT